MGIGRFAFTPLLPLMQHEGGIALAQGASLAAANYLGYLVGALACMVVSPAPHRAAVTGLLAVAPLTAGMGLSETFGVWFALRLLAGAASAFVLVGVSAWALPLLAAEGRPSWSGRVTPAWVSASSSPGSWGSELASWGGRQRTHGSSWGAARRSWRSPCGGR